MSYHRITIVGVEENQRLCSYFPSALEHHPKAKIKVATNFASHNQNAPHDSSQQSQREGARTSADASHNQKRPYFWYSQSLLSSGHTWRVLSCGRTSGTPSPGCPTGTPGASSASARCSGSGTRGLQVQRQSGAMGGRTTHERQERMRRGRFPQRRRHKQRQHGSCCIEEARPESAARFDSLHVPHATVQSSELLDAWFAWHSIPASGHSTRQHRAWSTARRIRIGDDAFATGGSALSKLVADDSSLATHRGP